VASGRGEEAVAVQPEVGGSGVALFPNEDGLPIPVDDPMRPAWSVCLPDPDGYQVEITAYEPA
jgi:hypothetical protein